jgi:hypothetical protein
MLARERGAANEEKQITMRVLLREQQRQRCWACKPQRVLLHQQCC